MPGSRWTDCGIAGEAAVVLGDDLPGRLVKLPCAAIVAQSFPKAQDLLLIGLGQSVDRGQGGQETQEVRLDGFHLRLLEHDFAQPDRVRVARAAPRQIAGVLVVPCPQPAAKSPQPCRVKRQRFTRCGHRRFDWSADRSLPCGGQTEWYRSHWDPQRAPIEPTGGF